MVKAATGGLMMISIREVLSVDGKTALVSGDSRIRFTPAFLNKISDTGMESIYRVNQSKRTPM